MYENGCCLVDDDHFEYFSFVLYVWSSHCKAWFDGKFMLFALCTQAYFPTKLKRDFRDIPKS